MKIAIGTRFYGKDAEKLPELEAFVRKAAEFVDEVFVAINETEDKTRALDYLRKLEIPKLHVLGINAWGKFTTALNTIVYHTSSERFSHVLFCSPEIELSREMIEELASYMDEATLVVGAAVAGHEFEEGEHVGTGSRVPWNTLALWNLKYLARTGFVLAADAPFAPDAAGVEEVATCAVLQTLYPQLLVKLVALGKVKWNVDKSRIDVHIKKIESKNSRAEQQLKFLELQAPKVVHVSYS